MYQAVNKRLSAPPALGSCMSVYLSPPPCLPPSFLNVYALDPPNRRRARQNLSAAEKRVSLSLEIRGEGDFDPIARLPYLDFWTFPDLVAHGSPPVPLRCCTVYRYPRRPAFPTVTAAAALRGN